MKSITKEWIEKAEQDFLVAKREFEAVPPAYEPVCFHCQECIEKYLKAILQENDIYFEKIHDLDILLEQCKNLIPQIYGLKKELVELSSYAVEIRYPGISISDEETKKAIKVTREARDIIRRYFNLPGD